MAKRVVTAGGGLAGLTCAKYLVDEGFSVTHLEGLPYLGGRASTSPCLGMGSAGSRAAASGPGA
ncbi:NAD(P)-binding protein [Archangium minus]|uniref:NAD(P)-binding protein n=1 Tax=Archangium minus TaxID=83450 RepID=A0ABY9WPA6_9BACT|nr:NAD(P)-binding protein [Archangium minus]